MPPELLVRQRWEVAPQEWKVDDVVLVRRLQTGAVQLPRGSWPLARVVECHMGPDAVVRRLTVVRPDGKKMEVVSHHLVLVYRPGEEASEEPHEEAPEDAPEETPDETSGEAQESPAQEGP